MAQIRTYLPGDQAGVVDVILPIQREEFGVQITLEDQPDLHAIPEFYQRGNGNFWVAIDASTIVGTAALLDIGVRRAALRKMFVRAGYRGKASGVAQALIDTLLGWARARGLQEIILGTTDKYHAAHRFYEKNGFVRVTREKLPRRFPVMAVDSVFYLLTL